MAAVFCVKVGTLLVAFMEKYHSELHQDLQLPNSLELAPSGAPKDGLCEQH